MIALYILGSTALYLGIGAKAARVDIEDSIDNEVSAKGVARYAARTFMFWPVWVLSDGIRIWHKPYVARRIMERKELDAAEKEVDLLLEEHSVCAG